jgi:putative ATP-binding cassette transporter
VSSTVQAGSPAPSTEDSRSPGAGEAWRSFWHVAGRFWSGKSRRKAWLLTAVVAALVLANIALQYGINRWNAFFFDALERKDASSATLAISLFAGLALLAVTDAVLLVWARMTLAAEWRRWLTLDLTARWLGGRRFYQMGIAMPEIDAPEFRMTDDVRIATEPVVDFAIGLANSILLAMVFAVVLWTVGGAGTILGVPIPGYLLVAAVVYSSVTSGSMLFLGRPLIDRTQAKNAAEARSRFELGRVRENAESIALMGGETDESAAFSETLSDVLARWREVIWQQAKITWIIHGNFILAPVVPLLLAAPKYLSGGMTLGELMQCAAAFVQVQVAFNWLVENYIRVAEWFASWTRTHELWAACEALAATESKTERITLADSPDDHIHLRGLSVAQHNGRLVIGEAETDFSPGEKVLVQGESGSGKSTLIRAVAGLWPWGTGEVLLPRGAETAFLPQKPYIPLGTLRTALQYPKSDQTVEDAVLVDALHRCGLRHLAGRLDEDTRWDRILSGGEQQRLAFARLLVHHPRIVIMDEATSALDEASQDSMMSLFRAELADVTLISVGHRPGLEDYHDRTVVLHRHPDGAQLARGAQAAGTGFRSRVSQFLRRGLRPRPTPDPTAPGEDLP